MRLVLPHPGEARRRGYGYCLQAEDTRLDRAVALKFLPEKFFGNRIVLD